MNAKSLLRPAVYASLTASLLLTSGHATDSHFLYLRIYHQEPERLADRVLGYVPVDLEKPLPASPSGLTYVRVLGDLPQFTVGRLVEVLTRRKLTGIDLSAQSAFGDPDCARLSRLPSLHYLQLSGTAITDAIAKTATVNAIKRASTMDPAQTTILAGATLNVVAAKTTNCACIAYILGVRIA